MGMLSRFAGIFVSPHRVFDDIREGRVRWFEPFLIVAVFTVLITWLSIPVQRAALENGALDVPAEQVDQQLEMMDKFGFVQVVLAPAAVAIVSLVVAGLAYIMVTVMSRNATFKQFFTLMLFTSIVSTLGQLISVIMIRARGLDRILTADDTKLSLSLRFLAPENGAALKGMFASIEFFGIWSLILLAMGLMRVFGMTRGAAIACTIPVWILYIGAVIAGEVVGSIS